MPTNCFQSEDTSRGFGPGSKDDGVCAATQKTKQRSNSAATESREAPRGLLDLDSFIGGVSSSLFSTTAPTSLTPELSIRGHHNREYQSSRDTNVAKMGFPKSQERARSRTRP